MTSAIFSLKYWRLPQTVLVMALLSVSGMEQAGAIGQTAASAAADAEVAAFKAKILAGDSYALYQLAWLYLNGEKGAPKRPDLYHKFLVAAATRGETDAMVQLGYDYREGVGGVETDYPLSRKWYLAAYQRGNAAGAFGIGYLFGEGLGMEANPDVAEQYYQAAARGGQTAALTNIGLIYEKKENGCLAVSYYKRAASAGSSIGAANLGHSYMTGSCGKPDPASARLWFKKALAIKGDDEDTVKGREWAQSGLDDLNRPRDQAVASDNGGTSWLGGGCDDRCQKEKDYQMGMNLQQDYYDRLRSEPPPPPPPPTPVYNCFYAPGGSC